MADHEKRSIPETFIRDYVDELIRVARLFEKDSAMARAAADRAEAIMTMVKAWRERKR